MKPLPIACTLTPDQQRRGRLADLLLRAAEIDWLTDGCRVRLEAGEPSLPSALDMIRAERSCCPFLEFTLRFDQELGPVWLEIRGPAGTREFLEALLPAR